MVILSSAGATEPQREGSTSGEGNLTIRVFDELGRSVVCRLEKFTDPRRERDFVANFHGLQGTGIPYGAYDYTLSVGDPIPTGQMTEGRIEIWRPENLVVVTISSQFIPGMAIDTSTPPGFVMRGKLEPGGSLAAEAVRPQGTAWHDQFANFNIRNPNRSCTVHRFVSCRRRERVRMQSLHAIRSFYVIFGLTLTSIAALAQPDGYRLYSEGQTDLDNSNWQRALDKFSQVSKNEGALYWRAFAEFKLGRREDALATLASLRTLNPAGGWLGDAKTLEAAIQQSDGQPAKEEPDPRRRISDLASRLLTEPEAAAAQFRQILAGVNLPGAKRDAVFDLSRSNAPEARKLIEEIARGACNPDLQQSAFGVLGKNDPQLLLDIYWSLDSDGARRYIQTVFSGGRDKARLFVIARGENSEPLRRLALNQLVSIGAFSEASQLLQAEPSAQLRRDIETSLRYTRGRLQTDVATLRTSPDPQARKNAVYLLGRAGDESMDQTLASAYASEKDTEVRSTIVFTLAQRKSFQTLAEIGRGETDPDLKRRIVQFLADSAYLKELLK